MQLCDKNTIFALNGKNLTDVSQSKIKVTNTGVTQSSDQTKCYNNALYFNGSSYLTLDSTNLIPATGDWTIDWWEWRANGNVNGGIFHQNFGSCTGYGFLAGYVNGGNVQFYATNANSTWNIATEKSVGAVTYETWNHYAVVRSGSNFYLFKNGVLTTSFSSTASLMTSTQKIQIGIYDYSTSTYFKGYIDSLRVSNIARWTANFEPPKYADGMGYVKVEKTYKPLEYIESDGGQYIDTGFYPNQNTRVVAKYKMTNPSDSVWYKIWGSGNGSYTDDFCAWTHGTTKIQNYYGAKNIVNTTINGGTVEIDANKNVWKINSVTQTFDVQTFACEYPMRIFDINIDTNSSYVKSKMCLYYFKIYDNDTLVRDFIPVLDQHNVSCLFDKVENKLYYNQGTGQFKHSECVYLPEGYTQAAYIESTGTQYIDTGISVPCNSEKIIVEFAPMEDVTSNDNPLTGHAAPAWSWDANLTFVLNERMWTANTGYGFAEIKTGTFYKVEYTSSYCKVNDGTVLELAARTYTDGYNNTLCYASTKYGKHKIKSYKLYNGSTLVRDLVPCINASGEAGMYDLVNNQFYGNAGTGTFVVGDSIPDVEVQTYEAWQLLGDNIKTKVPKNLTVLDYIESTGTQYIDTGVSGTGGFKAVFDFELTQISSVAFVGSCASSTPYGRNYLGVDNIGAFEIGLCGFKQSSVVMSTHNRYSLEISTVIPNAYLKVNGTITDSFQSLISTSSENGYNLCGENVLIFALQYYVKHTPTNLAKGKLYGMKLYDKNNNLVRDYIPVLDENIVACLYDKVTNQCYYNQGTGVFVTPENAFIPVELPEGYQQVKYIQSTGTQWIDTEYYPTSDDLKIEIGFNITSLQTWRSLFGSEAGSSGAWSLIAITNGSKALTFYTGTTAGYGSIPMVSNTKYDMVCQSTDGTLTYNCNGTIGTTAITGSVNKAQSIFIFSQNSTVSGNTANQTTSMQLFYFKMYDHGVLVRYMIPCISTGNVIGVYDLVGKKFYTNAGTGTFASGSVVEKNVQQINTFEWRSAREMYIKTTENLTVLDYIESTGTQYIDTGIVWSSENVKTHIEFEYTKIGGSLHGSQITNGGATSITPYNTTTSTIGVYLGATSNALPLSIATNTKYTLVCEAKNNNFIRTLNDSVDSTTYSGSVQNGLSNFVFASNYNGVSEFSCIKLKSFKMWDNGVLVRDYTPVLDASGIACLYDKVTNQLFYNQGTGEFVAGYKSTFEPEIELAFLKSDGDSYIDTGFMPNQDTRVVMDIDIALGGATGSLFGGRVSYTNNDFSFWGTTADGGLTNYGNTSNSISYAVDGRHLIDKDKNITKIDGETVHTASVTTFQSAYNLYLLAAYENTGVDGRNCKGKLYSCKVYDNGTLVRDYIPKTDTQGVPALFDKVSGTYYYNQGTGTFNAGTILKRPYWKQVA